MDFVDWQGFLTRFASFGSEPTPARYLDLFHRERTVQLSGMARALARHEIPSSISVALSTMPDFRLRAVRWCARGDVLFVDAASSGTFRGARSPGLRSIVSTFAATE
jgi:hypothetical protein